jgi:FKBP-type peptidyl-prolyl cis-trans isomerase 2
MSKLSKINDQLMGLSLTELNQVLDMVYDVKTLKAKSVLTVGARVYVVQKTKKTPGTVRKINQTRAIVTMMGRDYNVPFSMLEAA